MEKMMEKPKVIKMEKIEDLNVMREVSCFCRAPEPKY